jgi:hypothetical protein
MTVTYEFSTLGDKIQECVPRYPENMIIFEDSMKGLSM